MSVVDKGNNMGVVSYTFNLNILPKMSHGVLECDSVMLQNDMLMILYIKKKGHYLCWTLYFNVSCTLIKQLKYNCIK